MIALKQLKRVQSNHEIAIEVSEVDKKRLIKKLGEIKPMISELKFKIYH